MVHSQQWLGEGAKGILRPGSENGLALVQNGVAPVQTGFGWCKRLLGDFCSLGLKYLLHPLLTTFGNSPFSGSLPELLDCNAGHKRQKRRNFYRQEVGRNNTQWMSKIIQICVCVCNISICTATITNENLESLFCFRFRNGKANKFPQIFFRFRFRNDHVGHAQATTAGLTYEIN